jgi:hypothetical protein
MISLLFISVRQFGFSFLAVARARVCARMCAYVCVRACVGAERMRACVHNVIIY